jgi:hypothetical protein
MTSSPPLRGSLQTVNVMDAMNKIPVVFNNVFGFSGRFGPFDSQVCIQNGAKNEFYGMWN